MRLFKLGPPFSLGSPAQLVSLVALCAAAAGCGNGDEAPGTSPDSGVGGSSGRGGSSGTSGSAGTGGRGGSGGSGGSGGTAGPDGGTDASPDSNGSDAGPDSSDDGGDAAPDVYVDPTVQGRVHTNAGTPVTGATVVIGDKVTVTDGTGDFTVTGVPATYDLMILQSPASGPKRVRVFAGLTTRQPTIREEVLVKENRAAVGGTLAPAARYPQGPQVHTAIGFDSINESVEFSSAIGPGQGPSFPASDLTWAGPSPLAGQIYALQYKTGTQSSLPTEYLGWGSQLLSVTNGVPTTATVTLGTVSRRELTGTVRFATGTGVGVVAFSVGTIEVGSVNFALENGATSFPYRILVPTGITQVPLVIKSLALTSLLEITGVASTRFNDSVTTLDLDHAAQPVPALPVDRATGVGADTEFAWTAVPNTVYCLTATSANDSSSFEICTKSTTAKLPDTASKGVPLSAGRYHWNVRALGPAASTDELVRGQDLLALNGKKFESFSTYREFTAP